MKKQLLILGAVLAVICVVIVSLHLMQPKTALKDTNTSIKTKDEILNTPLEISEDLKEEDSTSENPFENSEIGVECSEESEDELPSLSWYSNPDFDEVENPIIHQGATCTGTECVKEIQESIINDQPIVVIYNGDLTEEPIHYFGNSDLRTFCRDITPVGNDQLFLFRAEDNKVYVQLEDSVDALPQVQASLNFLFLPEYEIHADDTFSVEQMYSINTDAPQGNIYIRTHIGTQSIENVPIAVVPFKFKDMSFKDLFSYSVSYYGQDTGAWDLNRSEVESLLEEAETEADITNGYYLHLDNNRLYVGIR